MDQRRMGIGLTRMVSSLSLGPEHEATQGDMTMRSAKTALLLVVASATVWAQVNVGEQKAEAALPFTMTSTSTFELPWRIAFLPDSRMLVTEKVGPAWLVSAQGQKISPVGNTPAVTGR